MFGVTVAIDNILSLLPTVLFPHRKTAKMLTLLLTLRTGMIFADYQTRHKMQKSTESRNLPCFSVFKFGGRYKTRTCGRMPLRVRCPRLIRAAMPHSNMPQVRVYSISDKKENLQLIRIAGFMVDDTRLELVTSRTSSGCATSCANRPFSSATVILPDADGFVNTFFQFLT